MPWLREQKKRVSSMIQSCVVLSQLELIQIRDQVDACNSRYPGAKSVDSPRDVLGISLAWFLPFLGVGKHYNTSAISIRSNQAHPCE